MSVPAPIPSGSNLSRFLSLLPPLPAVVSVFSPEGGVVEVILAAVEGDRVIAYGPQVFMHEGAHITPQLRDDEGNGYDVELQVDEAYFQAGDQALLHLRVVDLVERSGHREAARARLSSLGRARVQFSETLSEGFEVEVRLADLSERGLAFITDLAPAVGDRFVLSASLDRRIIEIDALVTHVVPASFGRNRVGCEISVPNDDDRAVLEQVTHRVDASTVDDRRPELNNALTQSRTEQRALQQRLNIPRPHEQ